MIEVDNLDDVGMTYDLVRKHKIPVTITPGQAFERSYVLILLSESVGMDVSSMGGARGRHLSVRISSGDTFTGISPEAGGFDMPGEKK